MNAICDDLDMKYAGSFSADMSDLLKEEERDNLILFAEHFIKAIEKNIPTAKNFKPVTYGELNYNPGDVGSKVDIGSKKVVIVTDSEDGQPNLGRMIERFTKSFSNEVEVINLHDVDIKGGCLGCIQCGYDNTCSYGNKDGYMEFYNTKIKTADVLVLAGTIKDRYLSSRWKMFFDRSFFNGHAPTWTGKQVGLIISGPLSQIPNLRQILEAWVQMEQASLVDFVTDEYEDSAQIDALLQSLAERVVTFADENYIKPETFLGVGGRKIFRDDIWGRLRFPFQADHKYYGKHGIYDFPQKDRKARITNTILILLTKIPKMRKEIYSKRMKAEMIKPLQKVVEKE
jgi:multimeric flavodoxin WrbA